MPGRLADCISLFGSRFRAIFKFVYGLASGAASGSRIQVMPSMINAVLFDLDDTLTDRAASLSKYEEISSLVAERTRVFGNA
jgi:hypothetical protein